MESIFHTEFRIIVVLILVTHVYGNLLLAAVCDEDFAVFCESFIEAKFPYTITNANDSGPNTTIVGITFLTANDSYPGLLEDLEHLLRNRSLSLIVGFGSLATVNAASTIAQAFSVPLVAYTTSSTRHTLYSENTINLSADHAGLGRATATLVGRTMVGYTYILCQDTLLADGFRDGFAQKPTLDYNTSHQAVITASSSEHDLRLRLLTLHDAGYRIILLHCSQELLLRITSVAKQLHYFDQGYAWIVSESAIDHVGKDQELPYGLLAIGGQEVELYDWLVNRSMEAILQAFQVVLHRGTSTLGDRQERNAALISAIKDNRELFDENGIRKRLTYRLLNYVHSGGVTEWKTVGYIGEDKLDLETVVWPGQTIFGPVWSAREQLTIVTRQAEPFLFIQGEVTSTSDCAAYTSCLQMFTNNPVKIKAAIESFRNNVPDPNVTYSIHCCEGIVVDVLQSLAQDLQFDFVLYFQNDTNHGHYSKGEWSGMVGDVVSGAADVAAGALSVTSERLRDVTFTEPFYYAGFNMLSLKDKKYTSIVAFMYPFAPIVWCLIFISAFATAVATSLFEWNSPFGLNPWGRRRKRNYTLGSALTMVFSVWFGHIVNTKTPKSWPSKVLQNFWSAMAIFIIASYTANLAAYLAGSAYFATTYSILDTQLSHKKVGVIENSAAEEYVKTVNSELYFRLHKLRIDNVDEALHRLRSGSLDLYMDDGPLLEYALSKFDTHCDIKYAAHTFAENAYSFGLQKGSWLKAKLDPLILNYVELGLVEDLKWRYFGRNRFCENQLLSVGELQFGLPHTGGLFVMLSAALGLSFLLMCGEHVFYTYVVPRLRKKPQHSIWKHRNVEYFSQRLYRTINTEKVKPPASELAQLVRRKQFHKMFRPKNNLRRNAHSLPTNLEEASYRNNTFTELKQTLFRIAKLPDNRPQSELIHDINNVFVVSSKQLESYPTSATLDVIDELEEESHRHRPLLRTASGYSDGIDNPVFSDDEETNKITVALEYEPQTQQPKQENTRTIDHRRYYKRSHSRELNVSDHNRDISQEERARCRRYETWPAPGNFKRSIKRQRNALQPRSFSTADQGLSRGASSDSKCSGDKQLFPRMRFKSDSGFELKDNRVKSSIRRHAMASCDSYPDHGQDTAVDTLSKEDLLILWKRSEIELQTKLNNTISQNHHLRNLLQIVEETQASEPMGNTSISSRPGKTSLIVSTRL